MTVAWKRQLTQYDVPVFEQDLFAVYLQEALTGFAYIIDRPTIGNFNGQQCVLVPLHIWKLLKDLAATTVTPFRIVAIGKGIIVGAWQAHTGLKYAVRNDAMNPCTVHIPIADFKPLK